jgi:hypothetical protein
MKKNIFIIIALLSMAVSEQASMGMNTKGACKTAHSDCSCCHEKPQTNALVPVSDSNCSTVPICCIRDHSSSVTQVDPIHGFKTCKHVIKYKVIEYKSFKSFDGTQIIPDQNTGQSFLFSSNSISLRI